MDNLISNTGRTAAEANQMAGKACEDRDRYLFLNDVLRAYDGIMMNEPVFKANLIFGVAFIVEMMVSYPLNKDLVREWNIFSHELEWVGALLLSSTINGLAAWASHLFSKSRSTALCEWEACNTLYFKHNGNYSTDLIADDVAKETHRDKRMGWLVLAFALALVAALCYQRVTLLTMSNPDSTLLSWVSSILPFIVLAVEVLTGIYLVYVLKRLVISREMHRREKAFRAGLDRTAYLDRLVVSTFNQLELRAKAAARQTAGIFACLFRSKYRIEESGKYIDPVIWRSSTLQLVLVSSAGQAVRLAACVGLLMDGNFSTGLQVTDETGKVVLRWEGYLPNHVDTIIIEGVTYEGPFHADQVYVLRVSSTGFGRLGDDGIAGYLPAA